MAPRHILLGLALAATFAAVLLDWPVPRAASQALAVANPAAPPAQAAAQDGAPVPQETAPLRERYEAQSADAFAPRSWLPPPPPPPKPAAPKAPPLPFKFLGKVMQEGEVMAFLGQGARTHLVRAGDTVADYRVDAVTATEMTLVYLPLDETQRLTFGSDH